MKHNLTIELLTNQIIDEKSKIECLQIDIKSLEALLRKTKLNLSTSESNMKNYNESIAALTNTEDSQ